MNLTTASIQDYSSHATDTSVAGFDILGEAATSRKRYAVRLFYCLSVLIVYGWTRQGPQGRRCLTGMSTCLVPPTRLTSGGGSLNELEAHIMTTINSGAFAPVVFQFQSTSIRTFADDSGEPWFCANDVCEVLGYVNPRDAVSKHCRENGVAKRDTIDSMNRKQELTFINEGNLYRLIIKSRKPEAEKFEQLVMDEILPAIRKTGSYQHRPESLPAITADQIEKLIQKQLQKSLPVSQSHDCLLPPDQAKEILDRLDRLGKMFHPFSDQFLDVMGVIRALRGLHPNHGIEQPGYKAVIESMNR